MTTSSGIKIGEQRSQIIKQKKARDRRPFQSFGMQSAQSDQAQFVDAIDGGDAAVDVDTGNATALMHTPLSSRSNNENYQLSAHVATPLSNAFRDKEVEEQAANDDLGDPFYSQGGSKEE